MDIYRKIIEFATYTVFTAIIVGLGAIIIGFLFVGIQSIYTMLF